MPNVWKIETDLVEGDVQRRDCVVGDVERHLRQIRLVQPPAHALDGPQATHLARPAPLLAHVQSNSAHKQKLIFNIFIGIQI